MSRRFEEYGDLRAVSGSDGCMRTLRYLAGLVGPFVKRPGLSRNFPAVRILNRLVTVGLVGIVNNDRWERHYAVTSRGRAFVGTRRSP